MPHTMSEKRGGPPQARTSRSISRVPAKNDKHRNCHDAPLPTGPMMLLRLPEVAERLGCSTVTVRRRIESGQLRASQHGRILPVKWSDLVAAVLASRN